MVEAPEKIWATSAMTMDGQKWADDEGAEYLRADIAERQIAELRAERNRAKAIISRACNHLPNGAFCSPKATLDFMELVPDEVLLVTSDLVGKVQAAEAENARLKALPLKDEVERVLNESRRHVSENLIRMYGHDEFGEIRRIDALLSRLRAGEQEGWRDISIAPKDGTKVVLAEWDTWNECWRFGVSWWRKYLNEGEGFGWVGHKPTHWQPLPASPSVSDGGSRNG